MTKRLDSYLEIVYATPTEQHWFEKERSPKMACKILMADVKSVLTVPRNPLYAALVDFNAALYRMLKTEVGVITNVLNLLARSL